jgi:hypothetical protein
MSGPLGIGRLYTYVREPARDDGICESATHTGWCTSCQLKSRGKQLPSTTAAAAVAANQRFVTVFQLTNTKCFRREFFGFLLGASAVRPPDARILRLSTR